MYGKRMKKNKGKSQQGWINLFDKNNYFQKNSWNDLGLIHSALLDAKDLIKKNPNDLLFVKRTLKKNLMDLTNVLPKPLKLMSTLLTLMFFLCARQNP